MEKVTALGLDPGEAAAISLAIEMHADAVLIDEKKGRRIAKLQGLATLGTITVLELASQAELLDLKATLSLLQRSSFYITGGICQRSLGSRC